MKEKLFSVVSLGFLTVGFIVGVAGADKDGPKDLAHATDQLIQHVTVANEANEINRSRTVITPSNDEFRDQASDSPKDKKKTVIISGTTVTARTHPAPIKGVPKKN